MPFYPNHVVEHVRAQRREGSSIKALAKTFGICYTTIARWVYDIPSDSAQFKKARARDEAYRTLLTFWSEKLAIPPSRFHKPTVTAAGQKMKHRDYMGTCTVKYFDVSLLLHITGIHEALAEKFTNSPEGNLT